MTVLIPQLQTIADRLHPEQKHLARRLELLLGEDCLCWIKPKINNSSTYPSFLILHPNRGLLLLDLIVWGPSVIKRINAKAVEVETKQGRKRVANPVTKIAQYSTEVLELLNHDESLSHEIRKANNDQFLPFGHGVIFSNISRKKFHQAIPEEKRNDILPDQYIICQEELTSSDNQLNFQQRLWGMVKGSLQKNLHASHIDRIRWNLYPEIRIKNLNIETPPSNDSLEKSFKKSYLGELIENPNGKKPDNNEESATSFKPFSIEQEHILRKPNTGYHIIEGGVGSGKTALLLQRGLLLEKTSEKPILFLSFNIPIANKMKAHINKEGLQKKIKVHYFNEWCAEQLRNAKQGTVTSLGIHASSTDKSIAEKQIKSLTEAINDGKIPQHQYGAILVDEADNFSQQQWLSVLTHMFDKESASLLLAYNDHHFSPTGAITGNSKSNKPVSPDSYTFLNKNYRNTATIAKYASRLLENYNNHYQPDSNALSAAHTATYHGEKPIVKQLDNIHDETQSALIYIKKISGDTKNWKKIAIIYSSNEVGKKMSSGLKTHRIPHHWLASDLYNKAYNPNSNKVALIPMSNAKNLEFDTVILLDASFMGEVKEMSQHIFTQENQSQLKKNIYLLHNSILRAKHHLLISYHRTNKLSYLINQVENTPAGTIT